MATMDFFLKVLLQVKELSVLLLLLLLFSGIFRLLFFPQLHVPFFFYRAAEGNMPKARCQS